MKKSDHIMPKGFEVKPEWLKTDYPIKSSQQKTKFKSLYRMIDNCIACLLFLSFLAICMLFYLMVKS